METTIRFSKPADTIVELSSAVRSLESTDELYRLMVVEDGSFQREAIDFRRLPLKGTPGARLSSFKVSSPLEITIEAENLWLAVVVFLLKDYSSVKKNVTEISNDLGSLRHIVGRISDQEWMQVEIGVKMLIEQIADMTQENRKRIEAKISTARKWVNIESISKIERRD